MSKTIFTISVIAFLLLTACQIKTHREDIFENAEIPNEWSYIDVYKNMRPSINNYPKLFLPVPPGDHFDTQPFGARSKPKLSYDLFTESEEKFIDDCKISPSENKYINKKNIVDEMDIVCPSPFEHEKYLFRLNANGTIFYAHPGFLSTEEQRKLIINSLLNARIDK